MAIFSICLLIVITIMLIMAIYNLITFNKFLKEIKKTLDKSAEK